MKWSQIASPESWRGLALETYWSFASHRQPVLASTWPLSRDEIETIYISWPSRYDWPHADKWVEPLRHALSKHVRTEMAAISQPYKGIVLIQVFVRGRTYEVAIDYADRPSINQTCVRRCLVYFKMQFSRGGYPWSNVLPGGFVPNGDRIYRYLQHLRALADRGAYRYDVYGRFGLEFASEIRSKACSLLASQKQFRWEGGLRIKRYSLALREIARSKICIDLPGNGDLCFRLIDYLAIGSCVVAPRHQTILHVPLEDRMHIVYVKEDLSDLVDICKFYLENEEQRERIRRNSRSFFDKYLHREQLAAYYLRSCLDRLA